MCWPLSVVSSLATLIGSEDREEAKSGQLEWTRRLWGLFSSRELHKPAAHLQCLVATWPPTGRAFLKLRPAKGKAWHRNGWRQTAKVTWSVLPEFRLATGLYSSRSPDITASSSFKLLPLGIQQTSQKQALYSSIEETPRRTSLDKQMCFPRPRNKLEVKDQSGATQILAESSVPASESPGTRYWARRFVIVQQAAPDKPSPLLQSTLTPHTSFQQLGASTHIPTATGAQRMDLRWEFLRLVLFFCSKLPSSIEKPVSHFTLLESF